MSENLRQMRYRQAISPCSFTETTFMHFVVGGSICKVGYEFINRTCEHFLNIRMFPVEGVYMQI